MTGRACVLHVQMNGPGADVALAHDVSIRGQDDLRRLVQRREHPPRPQRRQQAAIGQRRPGRHQDAGAVVQRQPPVCTVVVLVRARRNVIPRFQESLPPGLKAGDGRLTLRGVFGERGRVGHLGQHHHRIAIAVVSKGAAADPKLPRARVIKLPHHPFLLHQLVQRGVVIFRYFQAANELAFAVVLPVDKRRRIDQPDVPAAADHAPLAAIRGDKAGVTARIGNGLRDSTCKQAIGRRRICRAVYARRAVKHMVVIRGQQEVEPRLRARHLVGSAGTQSAPLRDLSPVAGGNRHAAIAVVGLAVQGAQINRIRQPARRRSQRLCSGAYWQSGKAGQTWRRYGADLDRMLLLIGQPARLAGKLQRVVSRWHHAPAAIPPIPAHRHRAQTLAACHRARKAAEQRAAF